MKILESTRFWKSRSNRWMMEKNPILNSPYLEPKFHYSTAEDGSLDYESVVKGRRLFIPTGQVIPIRQGPQRNLGYGDQSTPEIDSHIINLCRKESLNGAMSNIQTQQELRRNY